MSDLFYSAFVTAARHVFWLSSKPVVIGTEHTRLEGAYILAANHSSPFDVAVLIRHAKRHVDFLSITEVFKKPLVGWFYGSMNAFPLDRSRRDPKTVKTMVDRLKRGRVIGMFPEGGLRGGEQSVLKTRKIKPGVGRLALLANVPIVPAVVVGSAGYLRPGAWAPIRKTRYGVIFGEAILPEGTAEEMEGRYVERLIGLHEQLIAVAPHLIPSPAGESTEDSNHER